MSRLVVSVLYLKVPMLLCAYQESSTLCGY